MEADLEADTNGISVQRSAGSDSAPQHVGLNSGKASYASCSLAPVTTDKELNTSPTRDNNNTKTRTQSELYGPWMVAKDRRHRSLAPKDVGRSSAGLDGIIPGSRFAVLHDEHAAEHMDADIVENPRTVDTQTEKANSQGMGDGVTTMNRNEQEKGTRFAAYRKSSPSRRVKDTGNVTIMDKTVHIVPLVEGSTVVVASHALANNSGEHIAYSIQEKNGDDRNSIRDRFNDRSTNRGKGFKEVNAKGLKIRKTVDVHSPHIVLLSDWVQSASNQLHLAAESSRARLDTGHAMEEDGREAVSPRPLLGSQVDICGELDTTDRGCGEHGISMLLERFCS
ncbi:hypothetical protein V6N13_095937 [Hibiscus sabdariffa]